MILNTKKKNPKDSDRNLPQLINILSIIVRFKKKKSVAFLYVNNKHMEKEIRGKCKSLKIISVYVGGGGKSNQKFDL